MLISAGEALVDLVPDPVPGGGPLNAAVAAARLGLESAFLGRVSTDDHGEACLAHLAASGVRLDLVQRGPEPTAQAIVDPGPPLAFTFLGEGTADTLLADVDLGPIGAGPHILHGGTLGMFRGRTAETLASLAEAHDGLVSLDPNVRPQIIEDRVAWLELYRRWVAVADVVRLSDEDMAWIDPDASRESFARGLHDAGVGVVIVTEGEEGATAYFPVGSVHADGVAVDVVDTVGAGDTFVGAVLAGLDRRGVADRTGLDQVRGDDWAEILGFAVVAAGITCTRLGADPPTRDEVEAFMT